MGANFDERDLASAIIEDTLSKKAASTVLFSKKARQEKPTARKVFFYFGMIYLSFMVLATILVQQDYEDTFGANVDTIKEIVSSNFDVNVISVLGIAQDERQMFAAAVYDKDGAIISMTKPSLCFLSEEGGKYYFPLEEYFDDSQIQEILVYGRNTSEEYRIEAKMEVQSEKLLSLEFISEDIVKKNIVWQWENKKIDSDIQEEVYQFSSRMPVRKMLAVPYFEEEEIYKKWLNNEYLQGFDLKLDQETLRTSENYEIFTLSKTEVEHITEVTFTNDLGEEEICFVAIRSVGNTLIAAMKMLMPVYIIGVVITLGGIYSVLGNMRRRGKNSH